MRRLLLAASVLAAARAGRYRHIRKQNDLPTQHNESRAPKTPILYFHFHKAGGTRNEGHPRPRCFNIHEVKPHPSLWETMTGLWKGKDKKSVINAAIYLETHE